MSFFISDAFAEGAAAADAVPQDGGWMGMLPLLLIFVLFYFMLIRPQAKRAKEHKNMVATLDKGDEVVTNGGLLGRVTDVGESFLTVKIAEGVEVKVQKQSVSALVPKGTLKSEVKNSGKKSD
ncbi:MAG: preprotein translocase subunit YajC [Gammaproteobacteria bacterium]|nr:preprotein translocase subunit YajC [Gammaproteobacteria bacterium]